MEKISVNPLSVRGLGDIVSPKLLSDFDVFDSVLSSGTDSVNGVEMTVFTESFRSGSVLVKSGDGFILYTPDLVSMPVIVTLKNKSGTVISGASVKCIVNDETTLSATTDSSGVASFTIPFVEGVSQYRLRFKYEGTSSVGGCSVYGYIFVGVPTDLILNGSSEIIQSGDEVNLVATLHGTDVNGESVPIPSVIVMFYEEYNPTELVLNAVPSIIQSGDTANIIATLKDEDGSRIQGETVEIYEEVDLTGITLSVGKDVLSYADGDSTTLICTISGDDVEGRDVVFKANGEVLSTRQTSSRGVAYYVYNAQGVGDVEFTVECGSLVSETYSVEDCIFYHGDAITYTGTSTSDTVYSLGYDEIADLSNTDFEFSWKFHQTSRGADVCLGASSEFSVTPIKSNYRVYLGGNDSGVGRYGYRTTSSSTSTSGTVYANTVYDMKITRNSDTFSYYLDNALLGTKTASFFSNYNMFGIHTVQWNKGTTTISEIKIKPL